MSLDVTLKAVIETEVWTGNLTHNLFQMVEEAGEAYYLAIWRPEEVGITTAEQIIPVLEDLCTKLQREPERFKAHNPSNGWGSYDGLLNFALRYLNCCRIYPYAKIEVSR